MDAAKDFIIMFLALLVAALLVAFTFKVIKPATEGINQNITAMTDNMNQMGELEFASYDQQTVKGSTVESVVRLYKDREVAVVVKTKGTGAYKNYCALIGETSVSDNSSEAPTVSGDGISDDKFKNNELVGDLSFDEDSGEVKAYKQLKNINRKTNDEYINPSGNFQGALIRNKNGGIVGICFKQTGKDN